MHNTFGNSLLSAIHLTLMALGMGNQYLEQGVLGVTTLASVKSGFPLFTQIKSNSPERATTFIRTCMKVIPDKWFWDTLVEPNFKLESIRGKVIVVTGAGLSPSITDTIYQLHLDKDAQVGFLGVLRNGDPIQNLSGHLVIDLG